VREERRGIALAKNSTIPERDKGGEGKGRKRGVRLGISGREGRSSFSERTGRKRVTFPYRERALLSSSRKRGIEGW
jgi:hypothetical protein